MIQGYKKVSIIYGGSGGKYADKLNEKITMYAEQKRYPIQSYIIREKVLTGDVLSYLIQMFRESDFCIVILTADDTCVYGDVKQKRLRQNVIFELGMAMLNVGRDNCILISDFDAGSSEFELPSDLKSLEVRRFDERSIDEVYEDVVEKLVQLSSSASEGRNIRYDSLLTRENYFIDYEHVFDRNTALNIQGSNNYLGDTLEYWREECKSLNHYDERAVYILERIGFLPIFGSKPEVSQWLKSVSDMLANYKESDVSYYGNTAILDYVRYTVNCIIKYTEIKTVGRVPGRKDYIDLLADFDITERPDGVTVNPLIDIAYYDYLGLTYLKLYNFGKERKYAEKAKTAFEQAMQLTGIVDMSLKIWSGFITYNLARVCYELGYMDDADRNYKRAISVRRGWLNSSRYNIAVRNALSSEYFLAKINYITMCGVLNKMSQDELMMEYNNVEIALNEYCTSDEELERLTQIRSLLNRRRAGED